MEVDLLILSLCGLYFFVVFLFIGLRGRLQVPPNAIRESKPYANEGGVHTDHLYVESLLSLGGDI